MGQILAAHLFDILNLGHWDLFVIWFLVLGIFMIFLRRILVNHRHYLEKPRVLAPV